jgi:hypothetical protein
MSEKLIFACVLIFIASFSSHANGGPALTLVKSSGTTSIVGGTSSFYVDIAVVTHVIKNGTEDSPDSKALNIGCTNTAFPCSLVNSIQIIVNGSKVFVPQTLKCGLADLGGASLVVDSRARLAILTLYGGNGIGGYKTEIEFSDIQVHRKTKFKGEDPDVILEETRY